MNTKIIAVVNNKGGCGKTTTACALSAGLARGGKSVLLVDLDGQANATAAFGISTDGLTAYDLMEGRGGNAVAVGDGRLSILPSARDLSAADVELADCKDRTHRLAYALEPAKGDYDYIVVDTPPSMGLLTINALYAADMAVITVQPEPFAVMGLSSIMETIDSVSENKGMPIDCRILVCMFDGRKCLHSQIVSQLENAFACFKTRIRPNVSIAEACAAGCSIYDYAPRSNGAKDYSAFTSEVSAMFGQRVRKK